MDWYSNWIKEYGLVQDICIYGLYNACLYCAVGYVFQPFQSIQVINSEIKKNKCHDNMIYVIRSTIEYSEDFVRKYPVIYNSIASIRIYIIIYKTVVLCIMCVCVCVRCHKTSKMMTVNNKKFSFLSTYE